MKANQFAVIGLGRFGSNLAKELVDQGFEVMGIDKNEENVREMADILTYTAVADSTDEDVLRSLGIRNFDCVIVAIGDDMQSNVMTSIILQELGVKKVVAKALTDLHDRVLRKIGIERVIHPERDMAVRVAHQLVSPNLLDYIELSENYTVAELAVTHRISGKSLIQLNARARYGCSIVAINKSSGMVISPAADEQVFLHDVMVVIGTHDQIDKFEKEVIDE